MKIVFKTIILVTTYIIGIEAFAQNSDITSQRRCIDQAITTIEEYESMATIGDDEIRYAFMELFTENAMIFNDLPGVSTKDQLKVEEYCKLLTTGLRNKKASVKNIKTESVIKEGDRWMVTMSFDKSLSYVNNCGIYFSSEDIYSKDYRLVASMEYSPQTGTCKIKEIKGQADSKGGLPADFVVFEKKDPRDNQLLYRGNKLKFNRYNQSFLKGPVEKGNFVYKDPDVSATPVIEDQCNKVSIIYKAMPMRIKFHYDFGLGSTFSIDASTPLTESSSSSSLGMEVGYVFPSKSKLKTGMFLGIGMTNAQIKLGMNSTDYYYETDSDVDGDTYFRHYQDLALSQTAKLSEMNVPFYLDFDYRFNQFVSLYVDLGATANVSLSSKMDKAEGSAYVYGVYPGYNNLVLNEDWGYNGFGHQTYGKSENVSEKLDGISKTSVDALLGAGLRFGIPTTPLSVDLGISYRMGITELTTSDRSDLHLNSSASQPVVYNRIYGINSSENVRNLTDALSSIKRRSMKLTLGIIYKF